MADPSVFATLQKSESFYPFLNHKVLTNADRDHRFGLSCSPATWCETGSGETNNKGIQILKEEPGLHPQSAHLLSPGRLELPARTNKLPPLALSHIWCAITASMIPELPFSNLCCNMRDFCRAFVFFFFLFILSWMWAERNNRAPIQIHPLYLFFNLSIFLDAKPLVMHGSHNSVALWKTHFWLILTHWTSARKLLLCCLYEWSTHSHIFQSREREHLFWYHPADRMWGRRMCSFFFFWLIYHFSHTISLAYRLLSNSTPGETGSQVFGEFFLKSQIRSTVCKRDGGCI